MQQQFLGQVNIIGVAGRDNLADMEDFITSTGVDGFDHIADVDGEIWGQYGITSQPAFVFLNDDGTSEVLVSSLGEDGLIERVEGLLRS